MALEHFGVKRRAVWVTSLVAVKKESHCCTLQAHYMSKPKYVPISHTHIQQFLQIWTYAWYKRNLYAIRSHFPFTVPAWQRTCAWTELCGDMGCQRFLNPEHGRNWNINRSVARSQWDPWRGMITVMYSTKTLQNLVKIILPGRMEFIITDGWNGMLNRLRIRYGSDGKLLAIVYH